MDIAHDINTLRACGRTCVTADTGIDFGIKMHDHICRRLYLVELVALLFKREIRDGRDIHHILYTGFAAETVMELPLALYAVYHGTGAAEA